MAKPFFPWMGNKEKLVPYIHQLIPPHVKQFTEAFGGSGAVILGLQPKKGRLDIYNDLNDDLFNVFCCVKEKSFSLAKELKFCRCMAGHPSPSTAIWPLMSRTSIGILRRRNEL